VPRRLGELFAGVAVLPLGAVVTFTVATASGSFGVPIQGPPLDGTSSLLRFHILPLSDRLSLGPDSLSVPSLATLPPAPRLSPIEGETESTSIPTDTYTTADVETIITTAAQSNGVDPNWMIRTAECESGLNPSAYNSSGPYYGLFQFLMSTFHAHGGTNIWDPVQQSDIAASMFASGDSSAWPVCSHA
jgi:hypothetical protein